MPGVSTDRGKGKGRTITDTLGSIAGPDQKQQIDRYQRSIGAFGCACCSRNDVAPLSPRRGKP